MLSKSARNEAVKMANALSPLQRQFGATFSFGSPPSSRIPLFAVGYTGWSTMASLQSNLNTAPAIDGALVIDAGLYASNSGFFPHGPLALWGLIVELHRVTNSLQSASTDRRLRDLIRPSPTPTRPFAAADINGSLANTGGRNPDAQLR